MNKEWRHFSVRRTLDNFSSYDGRSEAYLEPGQTSKTKGYAKTANGFLLLTIFTKTPIFHI